MNIRMIKRRAYRSALFLIEERKRWYSDDMRAWERVPPVGREFGSPDYERLVREDCEKWLAKSDALLRV